MNISWKAHFLAFKRVESLKLTRAARRYDSRRDDDERERSSLSLRLDGIYGDLIFHIFIYLYIFIYIYFFTLQYLNNLRYFLYWKIFPPFYFCYHLSPLRNLSNYNRKGVQSWSKHGFHLHDSTNDEFSLTNHHSKIQSKHEATLLTFWGCTLTQQPAPRFPPFTRVTSGPYYARLS